MPKSLPNILTPEEQSHFLGQFNTRYATPHRNLCMVRIMLEAGLRVSEVIHLRPHDLDRNSGNLIIKKGKGGKDRIVWLRNDLINLIEDWEKRKPISQWLFPTSTGKKVAPQYMRAMVKRKAIQAEIPGAGERVSPHTFRHTAATELLKKTGNVERVRQMLGHVDIRSSQIYIHLVDDGLRDAMVGNPNSVKGNV